MSTSTVNVDEKLEDRMDRHSEINWSGVARQAIQERK